MHDTRPRDAHVQRRRDVHELASGRNDGYAEQLLRDRLAHEEEEAVADRQEEPATEQTSRDAAISAWLRLYGGNDIDVAADVGKFYDYFIAPALAIEREARDSPALDVEPYDMRVMVRALYSSGLTDDMTPSDRRKVAIRLRDSLREWSASLSNQPSTEPAE